MAVKTISPSEAFHNLKSGDPPVAQIIDVRTPAEFEQVHAEGAAWFRLMALIQGNCLRRGMVQTGSALRDLPIRLPGYQGMRAVRRGWFFQRTLHRGRHHRPGSRQVCRLCAARRKSFPLSGRSGLSRDRSCCWGWALGWLVHPAFFGMSVFIGAGLVFAGVTDWCGMGMLLARMPWNQAAKSPWGRSISEMMRRSPDQESCSSWCPVEPGVKLSLKSR